MVKVDRWLSYTGITVWELASTVSVFVVIIDLIISVFSSTIFYISSLSIKK